MAIDRTHENSFKFFCDLGIEKLKKSKEVFTELSEENSVGKAKEVLRNLKDFANIYRELNALAKNKRDAIKSLYTENLEDGP